MNYKHVSMTGITFVLLFVCGPGLRATVPKGRLVDAGSDDAGAVYAIGEEKIALSPAEDSMFKRAEAGDSAAQYEFAKKLNSWLGFREVSVQVAAEAFAWALRSAEQGNADGENYVGLCYRHGEGVASNSQECVRWLAKAARHGSPKAKVNLAQYFIDQGNFKNALMLARASAEEGFSDGQVMLGRMCLQGQGMPTNKTLAVECFRKAADQSSMEALLLLAMCYQQGDGVVADRSEAIRLYEQVAMQTNSLFDATLAKVGLASIYHNDKTTEGWRLSLRWAESALMRTGQKELKRAKKEALIALLQYQVGMSFKYGLGGEKDGRRARQYLQESSVNGNRDATRELAAGYADGSFGEEEPNKAFKIWKKLSEQGDVVGTEKVGWCYLNGLGVEEDDKAGVDLMLSAAKAGNASAQDQVGTIYWDGIFVPEDKTTAFEWYRKSANNGNANGLFHLGICYYTGCGTEKNLILAVRYWKKAAEAGMTDAQCNVGVCYSKGEGVEMDKAEAVKWYRKAAEIGNAKAQFCLACCYQKGEGVELSNKLASKWFGKAAEGFRKAAKRGNAQAQFDLACCYMKGEGVGRDDKQALIWFKKAADNGLAEAKEYIAAEERKRTEHELDKRRKQEAERQEELRRQQEEAEREAEEKRKLESPEYCIKNNYILTPEALSIVIREMRFRSDTGNEFVDRRETARHRGRFLGKSISLGGTILSVEDPTFGHGVKLIVNVHGEKISALFDGMSPDEAVTLRVGQEIYFEGIVSDRMNISSIAMDNCCFVRVKE